MPAKRKARSRTKPLFREPQSDLFQKSVEEEAAELRSTKVECLGIAFENDEARREYFLEKLREKLKDPEFRNIPGFPKGEDEDILHLSDPPYYTACPNPFLDDFVRCHGRPYDPAENYHREPFAVDVSVGKTDPLYKAHSYHTKVPYLAIVPSILHYTEPGDVVLDGFCGSGMTGIAGLWCGSAPTEYRKQVEGRWLAQGRGKPEWGERSVVLAELSPAATSIAQNFCLPFDATVFNRATSRLLDELDQLLGWAYQTEFPDGSIGKWDYMVWSEVFSCPDCSAQINYFEAGFNTSTYRTRDPILCPGCGVEVKKRNLDRLLVTVDDPVLKKPWRRIRIEPCLLNLRHNGAQVEKPPTPHDHQILSQLASKLAFSETPTLPLPLGDMYHGSRLLPKGFRNVHHLFLPRQAAALSFLWARARQEPDTRKRNMLFFFLDHGFRALSLLNLYKPIQFGRPGGSQVGNDIDGVYFVPSLIAECSPWYIFSRRRDRLAKIFERKIARKNSVIVGTADCSSSGLPENSIDYIFTDPPFGENKPYADLNFMFEAWHGVFTAVEKEAIVDRKRDKPISRYQDLMRECLSEYYRVLKPGRWMTVVFSNSSNAIWRAIQEAIGTAGFVIADVRTLDKKTGSYRQITSSAVKQDLVISAYKPTEGLVKTFKLDSSSETAVWTFIREHLSNLPVFVSQGDQAEIVAERTTQMLHDRMIAFHVQRGATVPLSTTEFLTGLNERFPERDGMYFLTEQVASYDRERAQVDQVEQLALIVTDEASAIQWIRQELRRAPRSFQDLQPPFMQEIRGWAKHEQTVELKEILEQNFLRFDGQGPIPSQIHSYLSSNFKDLRNLEKEDRKLKAKAKARWYVPSPEREGDLEKLREKTLLKIFEEYKTSTQRKIKNDLRTEAIRAGFKAAYDAGEYQTILDVAEKIPEKVLQEDEKLLMYYDVASTRLGE